MTIYDKALVSITFSGDWEYEPTPEQRDMVDILKFYYEGDIKTVDNVLGWWNLDQNWLEFHDTVEAEYSYAKPLKMLERDWLVLYQMLLKMKAVMIVYYYDEDGKLEQHG